tara:strand:- start:1069 stop:1683 length:615 start_codon:yes stop_codon:yes gene_type:complete
MNRVIGYGVMLGASLLIGTHTAHAACELTFGDYDLAPDGTGWVNVNWQCEQPVAGFQFDVSGMSISDIHSGICDDLGWSLNHDADTVLCFAITEPDIPPQDTPTHLLTLEIAAESDVLAFAESVIFAHPDGTEIDVDWTDTIILDDCPADVYPPDGGDGVVGVDEVLALLGDWGASGSPYDIDGDGTVGVNDLLAVLEAWGACD